MRFVQNFGDKRQYERCVHCGGPMESRDHAPSRIFLDEPYPDQLPLVWSCLRCNTGFSLDEEYVACLLECTLRGSTQPQAMQRAQIARILSDKPSLRARLEASRLQHQGRCMFQPEVERVERVVLKLARSHALFELNETLEGEPAYCAFRPMLTLGKRQRQQFESIMAASVWPEVGSRAMQRIAEREVGWLVVQSGRYRYQALADGNVTVRLVLSDYLAAEARW